MDNPIAERDREALASLGKSPILSRTSAPAHLPVSKDFPEIEDEGSGKSIDYGYRYVRQVEAAGME